MIPFPPDILEKFKTLPGPFGQYGLFLARQHYAPNTDMCNWAYPKDRVDYKTNAVVKGKPKKKEKMFLKTIQLDAKYLTKNRKTFIIYKWSTDCRSRTYNRSDVPQAAYIPWLHFKKGRFNKVELNQFNKVQYLYGPMSRALPPMHVWFKDEQALENWFGQELY